MSLVTRFPVRTEIVYERVVDFIAHLRGNGMRLGVLEVKIALNALKIIDVVKLKEVQLALKSVCVSDADQFEKFDDLFKAFWLNRGRENSKVEPQEDKPIHKGQSTNIDLLDEQMSACDTGNQDLPDDSDEGEASQSGEGKLISSKKHNINKADLREFMKPEDLAKAQKVAERIAKAIRDRRSRRKRADNKGRILDLRKMARMSVTSGGVPIRLAKKSKPDRQVNIVAILDVSGSMTVYARIFLSFLKGLVSADHRTEAYLFHTHLVKISDALRDPDSFRSINQLSMMAQGFGGGTKIGKNIELFNKQYAAHCVTGRSVVIILSDGYDTDPPEILANALARLKKKGCKIIWLNPLKGWKDYEPIAKGMAAALPHIDLFAAATTLDDLASLEPHLGRL